MMSIRFRGTAKEKVVIDYERRLREGADAAKVQKGFVLKQNFGYLETPSRIHPI
jgi:hypothetical protein